MCYSDVANRRIHSRARHIASSLNLRISESRRLTALLTLCIHCQRILSNTTCIALAWPRYGEVYSCKGEALFGGYGGGKTAADTRISASSDSVGQDRQVAKWTNKAHTDF